MAGHPVREAQAAEEGFALHVRRDETREQVRTCLAAGPRAAPADAH